MYIVTFEEHLVRPDQWIESHRIYNDLDEVKDLVEFIYGAREGVYRRVRVWEATEIDHLIKIKIEVILNKE